LYFLVSTNRDGSYDIRYADGDEETKVPARYVRASDGSSMDSRSSPSTIGSRTTPNGAYNYGDRIEARYKGGTKYFPGNYSVVTTMVQ
jgi:hypothetical protein